MTFLGVKDAFVDAVIECKSAASVEVIVAASVAVVVVVVVAVVVMVVAERKGSGVQCEDDAVGRM